MPDGQGLIVDLIVIIAAAMAGGMLASFLRMPVIVGYLVAGLVVGHYIPGLEMDVESIRDIAELGVVLLLFGLGIHFSTAKLATVWRVATVAGPVQVLLTIGVGVAIGRALGLDIDEALVLGAAMSLSSTTVVVKLLDARGELRAVYGQVAIGILLVQDLAVGPLVVLIPVIDGGTGASIAGDVGIAVGKALLLLGGAYVLGRIVVPWLFPRVVATGSRELFTLAVLALAVGMAAGSFALGLSVAFGAFLGGLIVSQSRFSHQTLAEVLPLRDVFVALFFVSMGLLIDPAVLVDHPTLVAGIVAGLIVGKVLLVVPLVTLLGYPLRTAVLAGLALAQGGEFSFIVARVGVDEGIISDELNSAILMATLVSILVTPLVLEAGPRALSWAAAIPRLGRLLEEPVVAELGDDQAVIRGHVVICGFGRIGREIVREMGPRKFPCVVIERDPYLIDQLRHLDVPHVYGDAANRDVLDAARLDRARVLAITLPDPVAAQLAVENARQLNPGLDVIVRGRGQEDHDRLLLAGAAEVVHPEFEAGLEFARHTLHRFGVDSKQIQALLARRRRDLYGG